jgi:hypothetical protein
LNRLLILTIFYLVSIHLFSQSIRDYNIDVTCFSRTLNSTSSILDFKWKNPPPTSIGQRVYRKSKDAYSWGNVYKNLNSNDTAFSDTILTGGHYEYRIEKDTGRDGYSIQGYIYAGHRVLPLKQRGTILLIIDSTHRVFLSNEIRTFRNDLIGDGWFTKVLWVSPSTTVSTIKSYIVTEYNANPSQVKNVCLVGNVAVPYSGDYNATIYPPDGHYPDHCGAWPADIYYGDMNNSSWTDNTVTNNLGARAANNNNTSDGKFDQTSIPTLIELGVGRIDLSDFTSFSETERELLRRYFNKNHDYKHMNFNTIPRCLIDDNFGLINYPYPYFDEHFAGNAYRNTAPLVNYDSCFSLDYLTTLNSQSYQWSYGFGAGSYTNASGVATTAQLASSTQEIKSVFTGLFGSYFGDWDNTNNFLRAPLAAKGHVLNSFWVGRPHWFFHHMGLGETIGYSTLRTENNYNTSTFDYLYPTTSYGYLQIHIALMGDPTTRQNVVEPASDFSVSQDSCNQRFILNWLGSSDTAVHHYIVFRANHIDSVFTEIGTTQNLTFTDSFPLSGNNIYMLRGLKLQISGSGSYFNLSQGLFDTISYYIPVSNAGSDTSFCLNSIVNLGFLPLQNNVHTTYHWMPDDIRTPLLTTQVLGNDTKYLFIRDTITGCDLLDTLIIQSIDLPSKENVFFNYNLCYDSLEWSCSNLNPSNYIYSWQFNGGNPTDTSGVLLTDPGWVIYNNPGTYIMTLNVTNPANNCFIPDTFLHDVFCTTLNVNELKINCNNDIIRVILTNDIINQYGFILLYGLLDNQWVFIDRIRTIYNQNIYIFNINNVYSDYQLRGVMNGFSSEVELINCSSFNEINQISIYPNPFKNSINIDIHDSNPISKTYNIEIMSFDGKLVHQSFHNERFVTLNLENFNTGIYLIKVIHQDKISSIKINKQ